MSEEKLNEPETCIDPSCEICDDPHLESALEAEPEPVPPAPEPEVFLPSTIIGPKHNDISEDFLSKVRAIIGGQVPIKLMDYGVKRARGSWDSNDEFMTVHLTDGSERKLTLKIESKAEA